MKPIKRPLTVRLDEDLLRVVRTQADRHGASVGSVVADAARRTLIPDEQQQHDHATQSAIDRCFNRIVQMDEQRREDHELIREMLALHVLSFYNHTPMPAKEVQAERKASAAKRFDHFLDRLTANLREGESIMDHPPAQAPTPEPERDETQ